VRRQKQPQLKKDAEFEKTTINWEKRLAHCAALVNKKNPKQQSTCVA